MDSHHLNTGQVWYSNGPNMSGCQKHSLVFKWWSENQTKNVCLMFKMAHLIMWSDNLKTRQKKCPKSQMFGFQVFQFQMVTVFYLYSLVSLAQTEELIERAKHRVDHLSMDVQLKMFFWSSVANYHHLVRFWFKKQTVTRPLCLVESHTLDAA